MPTRQDGVENRDKVYLLTAISILLTAISNCSRQFQLTHGNFNFIHGNFNLLTAISILLTAISIYSRQFQFFHSNAASSQHFSLRSLPVSYGGRQWPPKVKTQNQKWIFKVDLQRETDVKIKNQKSIYERFWVTVKTGHC